MTVNGSSPLCGVSPEWFGVAALRANGALGSAQRGLLLAAGSLTRRLRRSAAGRLRLRLLGERRTVIDDSLRALFGCDAGSGTLREIELCSGKQPWIYACTLIPDPTRAAHAWLDDLGDEPLGEALLRQPRVTRGPFTYAPVDATQTPYASHAGRVWARRSVFRLGDDPLYVTEFFLPPVLDHFERQLDAVE